MVPTILSDPPTPSRDSKCTDKKCLTNKKCTKDPLKPPESIPTENGSVMSELSIKRPSKNSESKLPKNNKIPPKSLSSPKKSPLLFFKIQQNKTKSAFLKSKLINKLLDLKAEGKRLKLVSLQCKNWQKESKKLSTITPRIST